MIVAVKGLQGLRGAWDDTKPLTAKTSPRKRQLQALRRTLPPRPPKVGRRDQSSRVAVRRQESLARNLRQRGRCRSSSRRSQNAFKMQEEATPQLPMRESEGIRGANPAILELEQPRRRGHVQGSHRFREAESAGVRRQLLSQQALPGQPVSSAL